MKGNNAIEVKGITKSFKIYEDKAFTLKERLIKPKRNGFARTNVLNGIDFEVAKGEAVGLIGKNGCGKSTTLKLLTRILYPNKGTIDMEGKVSSLIELGAGFHPDMTGRENIYTNASIFGIKKKEVDERLGDIIRFSELESFIDNPVRTYSSGMYMRLAFAVAINVNANILLIDEILAVGDASFQKKCFEKLKEIKAKGTTIVIVSHSMEQMYKICDRLIWIEDGFIKKVGSPKVVGEEYLAEMEGRRLERVSDEEDQKKKELEAQIKQEKEKIAKEEAKRVREEEKRRKEEEKIKKEEEEKESLLRLKELERQKREMDKNESLRSITKFYRPGARRTGDGNVLFTNITIKDSRGIEKTVFATRDKIIVELEYKSQKDNLSGEFVVCFTRDDGVYCYGSTTFLETNAYLKLEHSGKVNFVVDSNVFLKGKFLLDFRVRKNKEYHYDNIFSLIEIEIKNLKNFESGIMTVPHHWEINGKILACNYNEVGINED